MKKLKIHRITALTCAFLISVSGLGMVKTAYAAQNTGSYTVKNYNAERKLELTQKIINAAKSGIEEIDLSDMDYIYPKGQYRKIKEEIMVCLHEANAVTHNLQTSFFYVDKSYYNANNEVVNGIKIEYLSQKEQGDLEKAIKEAMKSISSEMTDLDKIMALHNYIIRETDIDPNSSKDASKVKRESFTSYGVLVNGMGVCTGYSEAFSLLLNEAGIENHYVSGVAFGNLDHAWNMVKLDNNWYHVDVMWDDEKTENSVLQNIPLIGKNQSFFDYPVYKYFLKSDNAMINKNHTYWDNTLPKAQNTKYDNDALFKTGGSDKHYYDGYWYYIKIGENNKPIIVKSDALGNKTEPLPVDREVYSLTGQGSKIYYSDFDNIYSYNLKTGEEEIYYTPKLGYGVLCIKTRDGKIKVQTYVKAK